MTDNNSVPQRFQSARELVDFLAARTTQEEYVYRGEAKEYAVIKPSLFRHTPEEQVWHESLMRGLALHLLDDYLRPHLVWDDDGPRYNGKWIGGDLQYAESYQAYPQNLWPLYQLEAILQHYGWRTHSLDVTAAPSVAVFFASLDFRNRRIVTEGEGIVYCWRRQDLWNVDAPVVDLKPISEVLSGVFTVQSTRPTAQEGAIVRLSGVPRHDQSFRHLKDSAEQLVFARADARDMIQDFDYYFPPDGLLEELRSFEQLYLRYCVDNRRYFEDEYISFLESKVNSQE